MNWAHLHLLLNHIPVVGALFGVLLLFISLALKSNELKKATLILFAIIALFSIPVFLTGEPAEGMVEHLDGVSESLIERHEESALVSLVTVELLGIVSLAGLFLLRRAPRLPAWLVALLLVLSIAAAASLTWTANLGREIRHSEIR